MSTIASDPRIADIAVDGLSFAACLYMVADLRAKVEYLRTRVALHGDERGIIANGIAVRERAIERIEAAMFREGAR